VGILLLLVWAIDILVWAYCCCWWLD